MITITIEGQDAQHARREMQALLGVTMSDAVERLASAKTGMNEAMRSAPRPRPEFAATPEAEEQPEQAVETAEETPAEPEQPRRGRGRPRKSPPVIDGESTLVSKTVTPAEPEQIDLEDVIAAKTETVPAPGDDEEVVEETGPNSDGAQPADPEKGWTHDDAKNVARQMYVRLGALQQHELDERLHNNLQKFGVQRIKDLPAEKIEAFVLAVEGEVA